MPLFLSFFFSLFFSPSLNFFIFFIFFTLMLDASVSPLDSLKGGGGGWVGAGWLGANCFRL